VDSFAEILEFGFHVAGRFISHDLMKSKKTDENPSALLLIVRCTDVWPYRLEECRRDIIE
jgi:hypothetical protein